jgi:hypothetical protein
MQFNSFSLSRKKDYMIISKFSLKSFFGQTDKQNHVLRLFDTMLNFVENL